MHKSRVFLSSAGTKSGTFLACRRPGDVALHKRVQDDLAALQLRQREALNEVTSAAASPSNFLRPPRGEETADTRPHSDQVCLKDACTSDLHGRNAVWMLHVSAGLANFVFGLRLPPLPPPGMTNNALYYANEVHGVYSEMQISRFQNQ